MTPCDVFLSNHQPFSMCKVLENRSQQDEERMDQLTNQLKEARLLAEDADGKSDEVSRKLAFVEDELEVAEDRVKSGEAKIMELEEELKVCWQLMRRGFNAILMSIIVPNRSLVTH